MIPFKLGTHSFELPTDYGELTFKQFYAIRKSNGDILDLFSILSGLPRETWEQVKDLDIDAKLGPYLSWMEQPFNPGAFILPDKLRINGEYYDRPRDIQLKTFGQKLALQNEVTRIGKEGGTDVDLCAYSLALYFQPIYFKGPYKADQVDELLPFVMECKLEEGYPIATFFLNNYLKYSQRKKRRFLTRLHQTKYEQELMSSKSSERLEQFTPWRRVLIRLTNKLSRWIIRKSSSRYGTKKTKHAIKES
jgi:hypothetical protein